VSTQGPGMIDLHNHLVYGVDDGAADIDESLEIARQFAAEGVTIVVATPHFDGDKPRSLTLGMLRERVDELREAIAASNIGVDLYCGNEIYLTPDVPTLLEQGQSPVGATRAILTEVSSCRRRCRSTSKTLCFGCSWPGTRSC
jgi:protein-tyrosine phosphatase